MTKEPEIVTEEPSKSVGRPPKKIETCKWVEKIAKEYEVAEIDSSFSRKRLIWEEAPCVNPANGINGFCQAHSYPVLSPVSKTVEEVSEEMVRTSSGAIHKFKETKSKKYIYNIGEHLPSDNFTDDEIREYYESGYIGKRISMTEVMSEKISKKLNDYEIGALLQNKTADEVIQILKINRYSEETLYKILAISTDSKVQQEIRRQIGK